MGNRARARSGARRGLVVGSGWIVGSWIALSAATLERHPTDNFAAVHSDAQVAVGNEFTCRNRSSSTIHQAFLLLLLKISSIEKKKGGGPGDVAGRPPGTSARILNNVCITDVDVGRSAKSDGRAFGWPERLAGAAPDGRALGQESRGERAGARWARKARAPVDGVAGLVRAGAAVCVGVVSQGGTPGLDGLGKD